MKINTGFKMGVDIDELGKLLTKNIEPCLHRDVQNAIDAVNIIWSRDYVVRFYTSHKLDHNFRVLYYCFELAKRCDITIDKTGYYILTMAALLHDIGMQCSDQEIINKYKQRSVNINRDDIVRKNHAKIGVDWIKKLYKKSNSDCGKLISLIDPRQMDSICKVIFYHSGKELFDLKDIPMYYHNSIEKSLMPIILILRLADELDIGSERSDSDISLRSHLEKDNLLYFWLHYITSITFVSHNILKITIETNSNDKDKWGVFENIIYDSFLKKNGQLLDMLKYHCHLYLSIECYKKSNDFLEEFNPEIYDFLLSKDIDDDRYFNDAIKITYEVPDIGEVYELDHKLLPWLYKDKQYAVTKEQSYICASTNPYMTIAAYKNEEVIGYLTLWPVSEDIFDNLLNFKMLESELEYCNDLYTYKENNIDICWYVSGLGVSNEERGRNNEPQILQQLIDNALIMTKEILKPRNIYVNKIGAVVYSRAAENLCFRHFGMKLVKNASYQVGKYIPKTVCVDTKTSSVKFIQKLRDIYDN